ncbi:MAG: saccharopine dehydrogenase [Cyclobacteriaceae bacterium]|nr:saccharopine dehydrogenase [Cyclobacteriaceae bacterium]
MDSILILGAGRSSSVLIDYILREALVSNWKVTVGDVSLTAAQERVGNFTNGNAIVFDINHESSDEIIKKSDIVISLIPPFLHPLVASKCLQFGKHLLTASYVSDEMKLFDPEANEKGLLFLNECGLDPGIDHMSAMQVIDRIKDGGGEPYSFESFTGGLIARETDIENPWRYKFTWNSRNVVMAGQGTARFIENGQYKYIPYQQLFKRKTPVTVSGYGEFEGYANRDSLKYREAYGLQNIKTMVRGTLRNAGFCSAWDILVQMGCTDDSYKMENVESMTHRDFMNSFLEYHSQWAVEEKIARKFYLDPAGPEMERLKWSNLFDKTIIGLSEGTPVQILECILNKRWKLDPEDKDLVVMWHRFRFLQNGSVKEIQSSLVATGENSIHTAMAKTVGLPLAIAAKLLMKGRIQQRGVVIPVSKEIYEPVLKELKELGIELNDQIM